MGAAPAPTHREPTLDDVVSTVVPDVLPSFGLLRPGLDDCGLVSLGAAGNLVISTDFVNASPAFIELGVDVDVAHCLGRLASVASLSDVICSGARPVGLVLNYAAPTAVVREELPAFLAGAREAAERYDTWILGGDTKMARTRVAAATALGMLDGERSYLARWNAEPGHLVCVSGPVGSFNAAVALCALRPESSDDPAVVAALVDPRVNRAVADVVAKHGGAGIDVTDGLAIDARRLAVASNVSLEIDLERLPIPELAVRAAQAARVDSLAFAFGTGGDFVHLFTVDRRASRDVEAAGGSVIGAVREGPAGIVTAVRGARRVQLDEWGHADGRFGSFGEEVLALVRTASARVERVAR
jgi:thiamine-monophosphate kinase